MSSVTSSDKSVATQAKPAVDHSKEGTLLPSLKPAVGTVISCEHTLTLSTGNFRAALAFNLMPDVVNLRRMFSEIMISGVRAEVRQDSLIGAESGDVTANGRIFVGIIPSGKNTDASSGKDAYTVLQVRRKQAFPLSSSVQENRVYSFDLKGFELDLAQDARRNQSPVGWLGNTGVLAANKGENFVICSVTWYFDCLCSGVAANW